MAVRVRHVTRTTQPQEAVKLSGAFSFNPEFTFLGSAYDVDPNNGKIWTPASVTRAVTQFGVGYTSSSGAAMSRTGISTAANQSVTFVAAFQATAAQAYNFIGSTSTTNSGFTLGDCFGGGASMGIQKGGVAALGAIAYSLNVPYYCVASVDGTAGTYYVLLCNAITGAITEESGSNASSATGGNGTAAVVNLNASPNAFSGSVALVACEFRAMPIEMGRVLVRNTWQLFEPEQIIVKAGAGVSGTTLTPGNLALTLTGYAPTVAQTANVTLTPGVVALTLTGFSPTVTQTAGVTLTPGTAALTLTGYAPTVAQTANVTLTPNVLALTLTGYAPTVGQTTGLNLIPDTVALTATGYAPTVAQTTNVFLTPSTLVLSLVGYAPTVTQTGTIVVTKGGTGRGSNLTLKQKKKLKAVVNQEWLKAEQTAKELLYERLGHAEPAKTKVERLTTVQSLGDVIAALQALSKETVTLPEQQAVIKSFEKSIDTKIVKTGERLVYVEDKVNETLGRIEKKIQNLEDLLIVIIDDLL